MRRMRSAMRTRPDHLRALALLVAGAFAAGLLALVPGAGVAFPGENGNIAYASLDGTDFEIYTIPPTGGAPTRLTDNAVQDSRPAFSPDGTKIAFISDRDIYAMDAADSDGDGNGDNLTRLTNNVASDQDPAYSPDGTKIAFETSRDGTEEAVNEEVYVMDAADSDGDGDGDNLTRLTNNTAEVDSDPSFSPDGNEIAFETVRDGTEEIYVMDATDSDGDGNGDNPTRLTRNAVFDANPSFLPDGNKIAFETLRDGNKEIYAMDAADSDGDGNGDNPTRLTNNTAMDQDPASSPDGTKIAFNSDRDGNKEVYAMDATDSDGDGNGDNPTRLTNNAAPDRYPHWGPLADVFPPPDCTKTGTSASETLTGTSDRDHVCGRGGNDTLRGLEGNDLLEGQGGNDKLYGDAHDDTLDGGRGEDTAAFTGSSTAITASLAGNTATGDGSDTLASVENLVGTSRNDTLSGSGKANNLDGDGGNDKLHGFGGKDKFNGDGGKDTFYARDSEGDTINCGSGTDTVYFDEGLDSVNPVNCENQNPP